MSTKSKNILLICGGGGTEHDISLISAQFIKKQIELASSNIPNLPNDLLVHYVEICKDGHRRTLDGKLCELRRAGELVIFHDSEKTQYDTIYLHFAIPCIHGYPGETGDIQSIFQMMGLPYLGCDSEASKICFNKVTTKLWLKELGIPVTPYVFLNNLENHHLQKAQDFFDEHRDIFVKASSQGSSIGTYHVTSRNELQHTIHKAFQFSPFVLLEKTIHARELEIAAYEYEDQLKITLPGEIICPNGFYDFEEKYHSKHNTTTDVVAKNVSQNIVKQMQEMAKLAFTGLKLRHLARIDFFYVPDTQEIFLNEINTMPGHTEISMFPMMVNNMLKQDSRDYSQFIKSIILKEARS